MCLGQERPFQRPLCVIAHVGLRSICKHVKFIHNSNLLYIKSTLSIHCALYLKKIIYKDLTILQPVAAQQSDCMPYN